MRLLRLDLLRYGIFTSRSIAFRPDARVHVVYGRNEAGKSTALAAIGDLLFGFPHQSAYGFLNDKTPLRLGAEIANRTGERLHFHRIKSRGLAKTLRSPDDEVLPDNALHPYLGPVDRRMFTRAFGLSTEAMRDGSRAMLAQEGEIGAALLGASSGVGDLQALQGRLEKEADDLFRSRKNSNVQFWSAYQRYKDANDARKQAELTAPKWKALNADIAALETKREAVRAALQENGARINRLNRLASVRPIINRIAARLADIDALGHLPMASANFHTELGEALGANRAALAARAKAEEARGRAEAELTAITFNEPLIEAGAEIDALAKRIGAYDDAVNRINEAEEAALQSAGQLRSLGIDLGITPDPDGDPADELERRRPTGAALERVRRLIADREHLDSAERSNAAAIADETETQARLTRERANVPSLIDPAQFRTGLDLLQHDLDLLAEEPDLITAIREEERRLLEEAGRLSPEAADLERLARVPRPSMETVQRYREEFRGLQEARSRAEATLADLKVEADATKQNLQQMQIDGIVVTDEMLVESRASRSLAWMGLRQALLADEKPSLADLASSIAAFEIAIARADSVADAAIRDAKRIEAYRQISLKLKEIEEKIQVQHDAIMLNEGDLAVRRDIWRDEWRDMNLVPLPPAEMETWLNKVEALLLRRDALEEKRGRLSLIRERAARVSEPLRDIASHMGLTAFEGLEPLVIAERIRSRLDELTLVWGTARDITIRLDDSAERLAGLQREEERIARQLADWQPLWAEATAALGLGIATSLAEAEAALAAFERLPQAIEAHRVALRRVEGLKAITHEFTRSALPHIANLADDLTFLRPDEAIGRLHDRLGEARKALVQRQSAERQFNVAIADFAEANDRIAATEARLAQLRHQAGLGEEADLADLHARLTRLTEITAALASERQLLAEQATGESEDELTAALAAFDPDAARAEIDERDRTLKQLEAEQLDLYSRWQALVHQREELTGGTGAELALQRRLIAESEMATVSREWIVLKLAATLVSKATARHRAGHHVPLIERAGHLFERITGGSFNGLVTEDDDKGRERLVGRRSDGSTVEIGRSGEDGTGGMSEGALDQLYLAMRLAHLEDFARTSEAAPFIGDDIFMTFDDERTALGLEALAEISPLIQPIVFTHHARVAEIARDRMGEAADIIEL